MLHRARGVAADHLQAFDAVGAALRQDGLDLGELGFALVATISLPHLRCGDAVRGAEFVEHAAAARAVQRALRAGRIIHAAMDHLAVARGHAIADAAGRFRDDHLVAGKRRRARDREPDHACSDDEDLHGEFFRLRRGDNLFLPLKGGGPIRA